MNRPPPKRQTQSRSDLAVGMRCDLGMKLGPMGLAASLLADNPSVNGIFGIYRGYTPPSNYLIGT